ncbi:hypothetical protein Mp_2g17980 [Marchantia polymorpha subsp. ruderalis]|uniref:Uncharacterized protein n=1 Tax=Marchantia polymorpha TaxID=3197 RepID=A0A2R6WGC0_MARPO|nr:hypothetical protein MARPO_0094s0066 [Marchantia polymorpha]BBN02771.1 hypothetical protein Mp_2g17980 [Marchantia polymorpha subsp. ruderalis]|eukprot:PTQ32897.1 hypothetical protein MARPO_0094s0066 [Marchantia polymorpha]
MHTRILCRTPGASLPAFLLASGAWPREPTEDGVQRQRGCRAADARCAMHSHGLELRSAGREPSKSSLVCCDAVV